MGVVAQQIVNGMLLGSIYALVATAFTLTMGVLNFLNFSIPAIFMIGGMITWAVATQFVAWPIAALCGVVVGGIASLLVERLTWRWLHSVDPVIPLASSLGFLILTEHLAVLGFGSHIQRFPATLEESSFRLAGLLVSIPQLVAMLLTVCLVAALRMLLQRTNLGRSLRAIAESPAIARTLGIDMFRVVPVLFLVSGMFTALGGVLFAINYQQVSPFMGMEVTSKSICAMILGGMGNVWGAVVGGVFIGVVEALSIHFFGGSGADIAVYGLILVVICIWPTGLFGDSLLGEQRA